MTETTTRLGLPLLAAGQAQKEMTHNEALLAIDVLLHGAVEEVGATSPPADPATGNAWILGAEPAGAWIGRAHCVAAWTIGGWRFFPPRAGMRLRCADGSTAVHDGSAWSIDGLDEAALRIAGVQVVGPRGAAVAATSGGLTIDAEARAAVAEILDRMRAHGLIEHG